MCRHKLVSGQLGTSECINLLKQEPSRDLVWLSGAYLDVKGDEVMSAMHVPGTPLIFCVSSK